MIPSRGNHLKKWAHIIVVSIVAGIAGGLGAIVLRLMVSWIHGFFFEWVLPYVSYNVGGFNIGYLIIPAFGALIAAPLILKLPELKGNGIPEVIEAVIFRDGEIPGGYTVAKIVATSITIGSGGSAGREGPIGFIGASMASLIARLFKLSEEMKKLFVASGLAAGIAGTFNAPLAGTMFALEVIYMGAIPINLVPIFISAITGDSIVRLIFKGGSGFIIPGNLGYDPLELPLLFILGSLLGVLAALYVKFFYWSSDVFESLRINPYLRLVLGGIGVGFLGMLFPDYGIFGIGYEGMNMAFYGKLSLGLLITLGVVKMLATVLTVGSGNSGGVFAPSLYTGAMFGAAFGIFVERIFPSLHPNPALYALAGMAAFYSGVSQAPINQTLMVAELTDSYRVLPASLTSALMGFVVARVLLRGESLYTIKLLRKGYNIKTGKPVILEAIPVRAAMTTNPIYVTKDTTLLEVMNLILETGHEYFPVVDDGLNVVGIVGVKDLRSLRKGRILAENVRVKDLISGDYAVSYPEETIMRALEKMITYDQKLIPVVESPGRRRLIGVITREDIYKAYFIGLEKMYID
jgi:CIC family chloride channel protein